MSEEKKQCSKSVWHRHNFYPCSKPAKVERNGHPYCTIHDPVHIQQGREKRDAEWKIQREAEKKIEAYKRAMWDLVEGVSTEEMVALGAGWLRRYLDQQKEPK